MPLASDDESMNRRTEPPMDRRGITYVALNPNETRIVVLHPGKPGTPLRARLEVVNIVDARKVRADYTVRTPAALGISSLQPSLHGLAVALERRHELYRQIVAVSDNVVLLNSKVSSLMDEYERLMQKLRDVDREAARATNSPAFHESHTDRSKLERWKHEVGSVAKVRGFIRSTDLHDDRSDVLSRLSYLLTVSRYLTRDELTWEAFSHGAFEALSYVWGTEYQADGILIDGHNQCLPITTSLFQAFQQLRLEDRSRRIWVDALCIDQHNVAERTQQLAIMSQIYSSATRVVVWLGCADETTCSGFVALNTNLARDEYSLLGRISLKSACAQTSALDRPLKRCVFCTRPLHDTPGETTDYRAAVGDLANRPWFRRMWVVQEVASATSTVEVHCGSHRAPWRAWRQNSYDYGLQTAFHPMTAISAAATFIGQPFSPSFLIWLLLQTADKQCQFPCDRFFAIQSILGIGVDQMDGIEADATPCELFSWLTARCLTTVSTTVASIAWRDHGVIDVPHVSILLSLAALTPSADGWPSWTPDFHRLPATATRLLSEYHGDLNREWLFPETDGPERFADHPRHSRPVSCPNQMRCRVSDCRRYLSIRGRCIGAISDIRSNSVHPFYRKNERKPVRGNGSKHLRQELRDWLRRCQEFVDTHLYDPTGCMFVKEIIQQINPTGNTSEYMVRMLGFKKLRGYMDKSVAVVDGEDGRSRRIRVFEACKEHLQDKNGMLNTFKVAEWTLSDMTPGQGSPTEPLYPIRERKLGAVKTGAGMLVGWIPVGAELNDQVCLFKGAPRPFLVRECEDKGCFTLLGDCWIHGMCEKEIEEFFRDDGKDDDGPYITLR